MVGENPSAAEGQGIDVAAVRIGAIVAGSALMGVAGAFLTLSAFNAFFFNMVNGRGWICVALVVFASWRPGKALLGALLFAFFDALQLRLQQAGGAGAAVPGLPDAAVRAVDPRAGAGGAPRGLPAGADEAVSQGRALMDRPDARALAHAMHRALAFCQQGNFAGADEICRAVLAQEPDVLRRAASGRRGRGPAGKEPRRDRPSDAGACRSMRTMPKRAATWASCWACSDATRRRSPCTSGRWPFEPDSAIAHYNRGNALRDLGRDDEALQSYGRARRHRTRLGPRASQSRRPRLRKGELPQALADYDRAAALAPGQAALHINRGVALYRLERHAEALASFETALAGEPSNADAHFNRGNALRALNRLEESLASYDRALALRPGFAEARHNRGVTLARPRAPCRRDLELRPGAGASTPGMPTPGPIAATPCVR